MNIAGKWIGIHTYGDEYTLDMHGKTVHVGKWKNEYKIILFSSELITVFSEINTSSFTIVAGSFSRANEDENNRLFCTNFRTFIVFRPIPNSSI